LTEYNASPSKLVADFVIPPPGGWKLYRFGDGAPKGHWDDIANHKEFFNDYFETYCKNNDDLYDVNLDKIKELGGRGLLVEHYDNSPSKFVMEMCDKIQWKGYKFSRTPTNYWLDEKNRKEWFDDFCIKRNLPDQDSLYLVTEKLIKDYHGISLLNVYYKASPAKLVVELSGYSDWKAEGFAKGKKYTELKLFECIKRNYPGVEYQKMFDLKFDSSGIRIGVDMFIPELKLAIEGQGEQHYVLSYFHRCISHKKGDAKCVDCLEKYHNQLKRDKEKRNKISDLGYKFLVVPFCDKDKLPEWIRGDWNSLKKIAKLQGIDI
jgi:G:T-mismatch repair DNA endonuclease (very short patch repair protein)